MKSNQVFDTILSTFDYHGYLLQIIIYQQLSEYDFVGVHYCLIYLNSHVIIDIEILIPQEKYSMPNSNTLIDIDNFSKNSGLIQLYMWPGMEK